MILVNKERHYLLPSIPSRGHGLVLLMTWTLLFISENLSIVNLKKEDWWFHIDTVKDKTEFSLFVARYVSCLLIFILGLKAPGIASNREDDYIHLVNDSNNQESRSTWNNGWKKLMTLLPFMWPKKSISLQFRVILCIVLLIGGRAINVLVPVFNKKIGL